MTTNNVTANSLGDSSRFNFKSSSGYIELNGIPYKFGSLLDFEVYIDPYMKYDDNRICLFNNCEINIENLNQSVNTDALSTNIIISYDLSYKVSDSKVIFILDGDETSTSYKKYKQLQRDIKINSLL